MKTPRPGYKHEALLNEYLALLDSPDAQAGFADSYRQKAKTKAIELLSAVRENLKEGYIK